MYQGVLRAEVLGVEAPAPQSRRYDCSPYLSSLRSENGLVYTANDHATALAEPNGLSGSALVKEGRCSQNGGGLVDFDLHSRKHRGSGSPANDRQDHATGCLPDSVGRTTAYQNQGKDKHESGEQLGVEERRYKETPPIVVIGGVRSSL